jgi:hypothetical protein
MTIVHADLAPDPETLAMTLISRIAGIPRAARITRSLALGGLALAFAGTSIGAQGTKKPTAEPASHDAHAMHAAPDAKPKLDAELAGHFKGIELTDDQVKQVTEIKAKHHKAMDALRKDAKDPSDPALKVAIQKHMDAEHAEFLAMLSPEQRKVFAENMKGHHRTDGEKHDMKPGAKPDAAHDAAHDAKHGTKAEAKSAAQKKP